MKEFNEYNHEEIETIADKFAKGEFVTKKELSIWYGYRNAVLSALRSKHDWEKRLAENGNEMPKFLRDIFNEAEKEIRWIRTINTFDLHEFCEYYLLANNHLDYTTMSIAMAERVKYQSTTETEEQFIREMFEESESLKSINNYREIKTPVNLRKWYWMYNPANSYCSTETASDGTMLYDSREHFVYIHSECHEHRWGETYWISIDCDNTLYALPVIKDFKNYDFEVGKFYKIKCEDVIHFGGNKKKYVMNIEESNEEEFMTKGFYQYATRW